MDKRPTFWISAVGALIAVKLVFVAVLHNAPKVARTFKPPLGFLIKTIGGAVRIGEYGGTAFRRVSISGGFVSEIRRVRILGVLPDNEQSFHNVFGKDTVYSSARSQELKSAAGDLSNLSGYSPFPSIDGEAAIKAAIDATADDQLLIVVGHSTDSGERLALTDGSKIPMDAIQYLATQSRKRCLIVTCHSKDLGLDSAISLTEAAKMCETAVSKVQSANGAAVDVGDVIREMRLVLERSRERSMTLTVTGMATGGASAGIYLTTFSNRQQHRPFAGSPTEALREHAEKGNPDAQFELGFRKFLYDSSSEGIALLEKSAAQKHPVASLFLAEKLYEGRSLEKDTVRAVGFYEIAAEAGEPRAQWMLGNCYADGNGVSHDAERAVKWLSAAARTGRSPTWMLRLGWRFYGGKGVPKDESQGFHWIIRAAEAGDSTAQFEVAKAYAHGRGVATNLVLATAWFEAIEEVKETGRFLDAFGGPHSMIPGATASPDQIAAGKALAYSWGSGKTTVLSSTTPP